MKRRTLLSAAAALAVPSIGNAQAAKPLRVVPDSDITVLDPVAGTTNIQTRDHAFMVFDTLMARTIRTARGLRWLRAMSSKAMERPGI